jgi:hypothetical protein
MRAATALLAWLLAGHTALAQAPRQAPPTEPEESETEPETPSKLGPVPILTKWTTTFYGFVEGQFISDSTESFNETAGNTAISRPGTYAAVHKRLTLGVRNSRLGFRINAPDFHRIRSSALAEVDFGGNQPPNASESAFFTNPTLRIRHGFLKVETDYVDVLIGQTWQLFGNQPYFDPNTVELQGLPGQVYGRAPQLRLSHLFFRSDPVSVEASVAASKPPQRDSHLPDGQAALRLMLNGRKGVHTLGSTGTALDPLLIAASGVVRRLSPAEFSASPVNDVSITGYGYTIDVLLPVLTATLENRGNALTINASFADGSGYADLFTSLTGGITFPNLPSGGTYPANIDSGIVVFTPDGALHSVNWRSVLVGAQYYLPPDGKLWFSGNFSQTYSSNAARLGPGSRIFDHSWWADANVFVEAMAALRFGFEYAYFHQTYVDGAIATNHRFQFSTWFIF